MEVGQAGPAAPAGATGYANGGRLIVGADGIITLRLVHNHGALDYRMTREQAQAFHNALGKKLAQGAGGGTQAAAPGTRQQPPPTIPPTHARSLPGGYSAWYHPGDGHTILPGWYAEGPKGDVLGPEDTELEALHLVDQMRSQETGG